MYKTKKYYEADKQYYIDKAANRKRILRLQVNEIKNVPCMDCGNSYPPYVMDFDHREGIKKNHVSRLVTDGTSLKNILDEIAKCDIVCANCHRIRTFKRQNLPQIS